MSMLIAHATAQRDAGLNREEGATMAGGSALDHKVRDNGNVAPASILHEGMVAASIANAFLKNATTHKLPHEEPRLPSIWLMMKFGVGYAGQWSLRGSYYGWWPGYGTSFWYCLSRHLGGWRCLCLEI